MFSDGKAVGNQMKDAMRLTTINDHVSSFSITQAVSFVKIFLSFSLSFATQSDISTLNRNGNEHLVNGTFLK